MPHIKSGTTTERLVRTIIPMVLFGGLAAAFLWDGYIKYPKDNAEEFVQSLGLESGVAPAIHDKLTASRGKQLAARTPDDPKLSEALAELGAAKLTHGADEYFLGPGGHLRVRRVRGTIQEVEWKKAGGHDDTDLLVQKILGFLLAPVCVAMVVLLIRAMRTRLELSDAGLQVGSRAAIPFEAMESLGLLKSKVSAVVELRYTLNSRSKTVRLDNYVIKEHRAIIDAICERTGMTNPLAQAKESANELEQTPVA